MKLDQGILTIPIRFGMTTLKSDLLKSPKARRKKWLIFLLMNGSGFRWNGWKDPQRKYFAAVFARAPF